jgi:hypothetical protein
MARADGVQGAGGGAQVLQAGAPGRAGQPQINGENVRVDVLEQPQAPPVPAGQNADANVEHTLALLRERSVRQATRQRAVGAATIGSAIGAIVGTLIIPGIGTAVGACVGALVFGAGGARIGRGKAKEQARAITLQSVARDYGPGSRTFAARAREAGHDPDSFSPEANDRMGETLAAILSARARQGRFFTRELVKSAQTALIRLETAPDLSERMRKDAHDRLRDALGHWADEDHEIDGARVERQVERAVGTLALARKAVCDALDRQADDGREMNLADADWPRAIEAMDSMALDRVFGGGARTGDDAFVQHAATALSDIAKSDLGDDLKNLVTDQLRASARVERVASAALPAIAASLIETPPDP